MGIQVEQETNTLWQDGCFGTPVTKGFLGFSNVETSVSSWQAADRAWAARAARGSGVLGGPGPIKTRTAYFYNGAFQTVRLDLGRPVPAVQDLFHRPAESVAQRAPQRTAVVPAAGPAAAAAEGPAARRLIRG